MAKRKQKVVERLAHGVLDFSNDILGPRGTNITNITVKPFKDASGNVIIPKVIEPSFMPSDLHIAKDAILLKLRRNKHFNTKQIRDALFPMEGPIKGVQRIEESGRRVRRVITASQDPRFLNFHDTMARAVGSRLAMGGVVRAAKREKAFLNRNTKAYKKLGYSAMHLLHSSVAKVGHDLYIEPAMTVQIGRQNLKFGKLAFAAGVGLAAGGYAYGHHLAKKARGRANEDPHHPIQDFPEGGLRQRTLIMMRNHFRETFGMRRQEHYDLPHRVGKKRNGRK